MALMITDECIGCDLCLDECPNQAISAKGDVFVIDSARCTQCVGHYDEPSCVPVCPVNCIVADPNNRESLDELADKYVRLHH